MVSRWRVTATLIACVSLVGQSRAYSPPGTTDPVLSKAIPAEPLSRALDDFALTSGLQLAYVSELARHRRSQSVAAGLSLPAALSSLLSGTGLSYEFLDARTVRIFAPPVSKQPAAETPGLAEQALSEVVVTATKREEPLRSVPLSITVLSAADIDAKGIVTIGDIVAQTPGLQFDFNTGFGPGLLSNIAMRGISDVQGAPTVGIYVDDVPIQASFSSFRNPYPVTFDLDRVEVLRGPQGTLFGSSALAGAVRFIPQPASTTDLSELYHGEVAGTQGGGMTAESGAAIGGPIIPGLLGGRLTAWYRNDGGYIDRINPFNDDTVDHDANRSTTEAVRGELTFELNDSLRISPSVMYQSVYLHDTPVFYSNLSVPGSGLLRNGRLLRQPERDSFAVTELKFEQRLGSAELTGISAYFDRRASAIVDYTNTACALYFGSCGNPLGPAYPSSYAQAVPAVLGQQQSAFSQELRLASAADARLTWLAGVFLWRTHLDESNDTYALIAPSNPGFYDLSLFYSLEVSVFGQLNYALTPHWRLGVGNRNGWVRGDSTSFQGGSANVGAIPFSHSVGSFKTLPSSPRLDVSYQVDDNHTFYAALAKGARGGGANETSSCDGAATPTSFSSDAIWNYELGAKGLLFDRRLRVSGSLFRIRWNSIQVHVENNCGIDYTTNAGGATSTGFDLALEALPNTRLRLGLTLGYTNARYTRTVLTGAGQIVVERDTVVGALPSVPAPWTGTLFAQYRQPLMGIVTGYASADDLVASRNPGPFTESNPDAASYAPDFHADPATNRLNLRLGLLRGGLDLRLSLENALNATPALHGNNDFNGSSLIYAYTFRPRTVGLVATWTGR
jgi:outer membrane receptor protein involved in Fe transport